MPINTACPHCQKRLRVPETAAGKKVRCPSCQGVFVASDSSAVLAVPAPQSAPASAPRPPAGTSSPPARAPGPPPLPSQSPSDEGVFASPARAPASSEQGRRRRPADDDDGGATDADESPPPDERAPRKFKPIAFNVLIKHDPDRHLKGVFQGTLGPKGLRLRQKKLDVDIPVGTEAEHLGSNRVALTLEDRQIEVTIVKQRLYVERLSKDVVRFLNGRKRALVENDYAMPVYLLGLTLLPLGIIFAGIGLAASSSGARPIVTGAIWGALGGGLSGACWWICQREKWPQGLRAGAALGLSVLGYGIFGLVLILTHAGVPDADWKEFTPPGAGCSIMMPGTPVIKQQMTPTPLGDVRVHFHTVERRDITFLLVYNDYPPLIAHANVEELLDGVQQGAAASVKGKVLRSQKISLNGIPGREVDIDAPSKGVTMTMRYYLSGVRLYQVGVAGRRMTPDSTEAKKLFASFKIHGRG
jgi:predicted Zn finger-like uncharacterized protein